MENATPIRCTLVVPCYNEADRLETSAFVEFTRSHPQYEILFVDDGSTDETLEVLRGLCRTNPEQLDYLEQTPNQGKAAAVRAGTLQTLEKRREFYGYWDADLATPLEEAIHFVTRLDLEPELLLVSGARVQLMGHDIRRKSYRHYAGRLFATLASLTLGLAYYDTQCGAKMFRSGPHTDLLWQDPFVTNWIFDVELIARLVKNAGRDMAERAIYEYPLSRWIDIAGSKVKPSDFLRALVELCQIRSTYF